MIRLRHKLLIHLLRVFDQVIVLLGLFLVASEATPIPMREEPTGILAVVLIVGGSIAIFNHVVQYDSNRFTALTTQLASVVKAATATAFLILAVSVVLSFPQVAPQEVVGLWALTTAALAASRVVVKQALLFSRRSGFTTRQLLIVGDNPRARRLAERFGSCPELGYRILGFVSEHPPEARVADDQGISGAIRGRLDDLQPLLERTVVDEMLICLPVGEHFESIAAAIRLGEQLGIVVRVIPDAAEAPLLRRIQVEEFDGQPVLTFFRESLLLQLMIKRLVDISASLALLAVLTPLLLAVALAIKAGSPGPVFFIQERVGMNRRRFHLYKFRSMTADAELRKLKFAHLNEMDGPVFKIANDPRVTPFGRFIRKTSIDELPQLLNVLSGEMSLVGPRPPVPSEVEQYEWLFQRRLSIKPGITCLWQVSGRNRVGFKEWMELDKQYVQNWSLWLDVKILLRTIPVVLLGRGAS